MTALATAVPLRTEQTYTAGSRFLRALRQHFLFLTGSDPLLVFRIQMQGLNGSSILAAAFDPVLMHSHNCPCNCSAPQDYKNTLLAAWVFVF